MIFVCLTKNRILMLSTSILVKAANSIEIWTLFPVIMSSFIYYIYKIRYINTIHELQWPILLRKVREFRCIYRFCCCIFFSFHFCFSLLSIYCIRFNSVKSKVHKFYWIWRIHSFVAFWQFILIFGMKLLSWKRHAYWSLIDFWIYLFFLFLLLFFYRFFETKHWTLCILCIYFKRSRFEY